jgi:UDP-N-acetyl-D-mannosaminuronic acid dehydrogenase
VNHVTFVLDSNTNIFQEISVFVFLFKIYRGFLVSLFTMNLVVVGGCGHVGLPLSVALAESHKVVSFDISEHAVNMVNSGLPPFWEPNLESDLKLALSGGFSATTDASSISSAEGVVIIVGTPIDIHLNPDPNAVVEAVENVAKYLHDDQLLVLRSTVFPGVTQQVERTLRRNNLSTRVVFCPERIAEGFAMKELHELPQIIGARNDEDFNRAAEIFTSLGVKVVRTTPEEAELAKLFTNTWRYIKFAAANQFWMMANDSGVNFDNVRDAIRFEYPRAADFPAAGFTAGPCLFKDTMQLAAFSNNTFALGNSAMMINEGLPLYVVERISEKYDLANIKVGLLGMAFKGESDDNRSSLAYKLKRILKFKSGGVLTCDPYVKNDSELVSLEQVVTESDILVISAPHLRYKDLVTDKPVIDIWNLRGDGSSV